MSCVNVSDIVLQLSGIGPSISRKNANDRAPDGPDALLSPLMEMADNHQIIRKVSSEVSRSDSVVVRAVASEVTRYASKFLGGLADMHDKILKRDAELVVEGEISLIRMRTAMKSWALVLRHLRHIVLELKAIDERQDLSIPVSFINNLHLDALTGYEDLKSLNRDLQNAVDRIYVLQIKKWCLYGQLYSNFPGDFFVHVDVNGQFYYRETDCPAMISAETSRRVFELGRMLSRIYANRPRDKAKQINSNNLGLHESTFNNLLVPLDIVMLDAAIENVERTVSQNVLSSILPRSRVRSFMLFLKDFFLLGNGEFTLRLIQVTQIDFRSMRKRHLGTLKDDTVHAVLAKTLSGLNYEDKHLAEYEDGDEHDQTIGGWRGLRMVLQDDDDDGDESERISFSHFLYGVPVQLRFQLVWPLDFLVTDHDMSQYSQVFNYLISLRRAQERLHSLWRDRRAAGAHASITPAVWSAAFQTQAFLGTMIEYYHANVISEYSRQIERGIANHYEMHDPARLSQHHRDAFKQMKRGIMLANHDFLVIMNQLFTTVDQVVEASDRGSEHAERCKAMVRLVERAINELVMEEGVDALLLKLQIDSSALHI